MMPVSVAAGWRLWALPLLAAAGASCAVWSFQAVRIDSNKAMHFQEMAALRADLAAARAAALEAARAQEQIFQARINEASHAHQQTLARARTDGRAARAELERLRDTLASPYGLSFPAASAGSLYPDPARALLGDCAAAYLDLAEQADGHAADVRLLIDSWPRQGSAE